MVVVIQGEGVIFFNRKSSTENLKFGCGFAALRFFVTNPLVQMSRRGSSIKTGSTKTQKAPRKREAFATVLPSD
jgi:hypothetical protein